MSAVGPMSDVHLDRQPDPNPVRSGFPYRTNTMGLNTIRPIYGFMSHTAQMGFFSLSSLSDDFATEGGLCVVGDLIHCVTLSAR